MNIFKKLLSFFTFWERGKKADPMPIPTPVDPTPVQPPTLWPAYAAQTFYGHGYASENDDREAAIKAARASGQNCLAVVMKQMAGDLSIHLLHWESDVDKGKFLYSWTDRAHDAGITRWQVNIAGFSLDYIADRFKAYTRDGGGYAVQFTGVQITAEVKAALGCDADGIKITEPRYR